MPVGAEIAAENETVTVQDGFGVHGTFVKVGVMPTGRVVLVTRKPRGPEVPLSTVAVIEDDSLVNPWVTVKLSGEGVDRLNVKGTSMVREKLTVLVTPPPAA